MPVIVLETKDFTSPLFLVRTWELLSGCITFSLVASLEPSELNKNPLKLEHLNIFKVFCMFTWCFFFGLTLLIHLISTIQFHNLVPISWKNLTVTVAVFGALMGFSASLIFPWIVMDHQEPSPHPVAAAVTSCLTLLAYTSESYILCSQAHDQRGYMGSTAGLLKIVQLWGGCQMIPLIVDLICFRLIGVGSWQLWVSGLLYAVCVLLSFSTLVVILGDNAVRCVLPFDRVLAGSSLIGVLFYMGATLICFSKLMQIQDFRNVVANQSPELVIMETVVASVTLLAYSVDLAFSIKLLFDRSHA